MGPYGLHMGPYETHMDPYGAHMGPYGIHMGPCSSGARNSTEMLDFEGIASGAIPLWGGAASLQPGIIYIHTCV